MENILELQRISKTFPKSSFALVKLFGKEMQDNALFQKYLEACQAVSDVFALSVSIPLGVSVIREMQRD